jgi:predicted Zn-dependent protease
MRSHERRAAFHTRARILLLYAALLCTSIPVLTDQARAAGFTLMSESQEIEQGKRLDDEIARKLGFYTEARLQAYVNEVGQRLVRAGSPRAFTYEFKIVDLAEENAFASMGGFVYITRGMLAELNSEAELAGVLAHEIGHISARHVPKQLTRALGYQLLGLGAIALGATLGTPSNNLGQAPLAVSAALLTVMRGYSRESELEADELGLFTEAEAGYDTRGLVGFLRSFRIKERLTGTGYHGLLATHPESAERIAKAEILAQILAAQRPGGEIGEDRYKRHLAGLPYGKWEDRLRLALYTVEPGDTPASISQKFRSEGEQTWDVARLNRLRSTDVLQPGQVLKIVVADERPPMFQRRRLDIREERPVSPPPLQRPTRPSRVPYPANPLDGRPPELR